MRNNPAYDPTDPRYFDETDLHSEIERVFNLCTDYQMYIKFYSNFPKMFDTIDNYYTNKKYTKIDTKKLKPHNINQIINLYFQYKLYYIKYPYTPNDHN